jgi:hypothetical protein
MVNWGNMKSVDGFKKQIPRNQQILKTFGILPQDKPWNLKAQKFLLLYLTMVLLLASCKTQRTIIKAPIKEYGSEFLIQKLDESELRFNWLSAKFSASYSQNKKDSHFSGQLRIRKDSVIWVSISPAMGIEMVRLMITTDSVKLLNRWEKEYFIGDYKVVNEFLQTNLNFDILQAFIIGNDFQFYENTSFRAAQDGGLYRLSSTNRHKIKKEFETSDSGPLTLIQNIWLDPYTFKILRVDVKEYIASNWKFEAYYNDFTSVDEQLIPSAIMVNITSDILQKMEIKYSKIRMDEPFSFPFTIPGKYEAMRYE